MSAVISNEEKFCDDHCTWLDHHEDCKACKGSAFMAAGGDNIGTWPCEFCSKPKKRPYAQPNAQRRSIYTDDKTWEKLVKLGNGNASAGIREAVKISEERG